MKPSLIERLRRGWLKHEFTPLEFEEAANEIEALRKQLRITEEVDTEMLADNEREIEALRKRLSACEEDVAKYTPCAVENALLRGQLAACEQDAARYRFIRSNRLGEKLARVYSEYEGGERLDAVIDEVMKDLK